jgi:hypothetical protein
LQTFTEVSIHINIAAIKNGAKWAQEQFEKKQRREVTDSFFNFMCKVDKSVGQQNLKRTHGLLVGPKTSFILAEALLSTIDKEIESAGINFLRFVDDYDIFVDNEFEVIEAEDKLNRILSEYGFTLNDSKTRIEKFPFYVYNDFKKIIKEDENLYSNYVLFADLEQNQKQKGAIYFFCNNVEKFEMIGKKMVLSLLLSILKNSPKSISSACQRLVSQSTPEEKSEVLLSLSKLLKYFVSKKYGLEETWITHAICKLNPDNIVELVPIDKLHNSLSLVVLLNEHLDQIKDIIIPIQRNDWLFNYELFQKRLIDFDEV